MTKDAMKGDGNLGNPADANLPFQRGMEGIIGTSRSLIQHFRNQVTH